MVLLQDLNCAARFLKFELVRVLDLADELQMFQGLIIEILFCMGQIILNTLNTLDYIREISQLLVWYLLS
jgi:hypothetical protein